MATHIASYPDDIDPIDITPRVANDWEQCHNQEFHPNAKGIDRIRDALADRIRTALRQLHKLK
jgi:lysophospholipase L1-like esterase